MSQPEAGKLTPSPTQTGGTPTATPQTLDFPMATPSSVWPPPVFPQGEARPDLEPRGGWAITSVTMINEAEGWATAGIQDPGDHTLRTMDGGQTWLDVTPPQPRPATDPDDQMATTFFLDAQHAWAVFHGRGYAIHRVPVSLWVWRTNDGGQSWALSEPVELLFLGNVDSQPYLYFIDTNHGWLLAREGFGGMHQYPVVMLTTEDSGKHWQIRARSYGSEEEVGIQSCSKSGIQMLSSQEGYLSLRAWCPIPEPRLYWTKDGGSSWTVVALPLPAEQTTEMFIAQCDVEQNILLASQTLLLALSCHWSDEGRVERHFGIAPRMKDIPGLTESILGDGSIH